MQSLWLDVDAGEGKQYDNASGAYTACIAFCAAAGLPQPIYVGSGYGLHVYWPLEEALSLREWEAYAKALKSLCNAHSFSADPSRTSDGASILRPVGAHNRKDPSAPRVVDWGGDVEPYPISAFSMLKIVVKEKPNAKPMSGQLAALAHVHDSIPSNPHQVADLCAQLGHFRATLGVMPEPEWKAGLAVLAFCEDGDDVAHDWSTGDERYDPAETDKKLTAAKALSGPTTCEHFNGLNNRCKSCPLRGTITSPVELGRGAPKATPAQIEFAKSFAEEEATLPVVGSFCHIGGALVFKSEKDGKDVHLRITQYPVVVEAISRAELNAEQHSIVLKHKPPHEGWQHSIVPLKTLFGSSGVAEVMGRGVVVHNGDLFKQYVRESMDQLNAQGRAQTQYDQFGWKDDETSFLIGQRLYTATDVREVPGGQEVRRRSKGMGAQKGGSMAAWKDSADMLFAPGFEAQGLAVLTSFSAPFMRWQAHAEGGAILSLISRQGGKGKSTALGAAASVWGRLEAMKQTNSDTRVARGIVTGVMGNLPVIRDEYTQRDPEALREEIQIFTEGRDKQRGAADGTLINMGASWQTIMIAGSNTSLVDTLRAAKNGEAMAGRIVEFIVDIPKNAQHWRGDALKDAMDDNAGFAGELFMRSVLQPANMTYLKNCLPQIREDLIKKHGLASDQRFVARWLAGVAVAGLVVRHLGLLDISTDRIIDWAQERLFNEDTASFRGRADEPSHMLARFLSDNLQSTLVMPGPFVPKQKQLPIKLPTRSLIIRQEVSSGKMFIEVKALRTWMQEQEQTWKDLMDDLKAKGLLINPSRYITLSAGTDMATGQVPCVELNSEHPLLTGVLAEVKKEQVA